MEEGNGLHFIAIEYDAKLFADRGELSNPSNVFSPMQHVLSLAILSFFKPHTCEKAISSTSNPFSSKQSNKIGVE